MKCSDIYYDGYHKLWYTHRNGNRLYMQRGFTKCQVQIYKAMLDKIESICKKFIIKSENIIPSIDELLGIKSIFGSYSMPHIYLWGAGKRLGEVYTAIDVRSCFIDGIVDSNADGVRMFCGYKIERPDILKKKSFDAVVITAINYEPIMKAYERMGCQTGVIVPFWENDVNSDCSITKFDNNTI